jgi:lysophospholipase L1-like esterase
MCAAMILSVCMSIRQLCLFAAFLAPSALSAADAFGLHDGDRVVFYGDSITDQRRYTAFAETYVVTRFPKLDVKFIHSGWGGDRVSGGAGGPIDVRLYRDVLPYNPTVVTIMLGMNDGSYRAYDPAIFDTFATGYKHIVDVLKRQLPGVRITAIQPSAYDDVTRAPSFEGGYNRVLTRYSDFLAELASTQKLDLANLNGPVVDMLTKANVLDATAAAKLVPDRIHPAEQATLVMAQGLLKSWKAPAIVTEVEIDAAHHTAAVQTNTHVSEVKSEKGLGWMQMDEALPMPLNRQDPLVALVLKSSDFVDALDREPLRVKGLARGNYRLDIDGDTAGTFSSEQLAAGINLADLPTPMNRQAAGVHALTLQHLNIHNTRWRQLQVPLQTNETPELLSALKSLDELDTRLVRDQRAAAQPHAHRYQLTAVE